MAVGLSKPHRNQGFTYIYLLVVTAIIGLGVVSFLSGRLFEKTKEKWEQSTTESHQTASIGPEEGATSSGEGEAKEALPQFKPPEDFWETQEPEKPAAEITPNPTPKQSLKPTPSEDSSNIFKSVPQPPEGKPDYPIIEYLEDSMGHREVGSNSNGVNFVLTSSVDRPQFKVGDSVTFTALGSDPDGDIVYYRFTAQTGQGYVRSDWSTTNNHTWKIEREDISDCSYFGVHIKDNNSIYRWGDRDDDASIAYDIRL